ncbi:hypothetical protein M8C21_018355, partial [Ambrosia artemisiifolia]
MADYAQQLIAGNPSLGQRITVIKGKVEDVELPEKADILISEPMGNLIHMAPFSDESLFIEIANMIISITICKKWSVRFTWFLLSVMQSLFWKKQDYYGVDLTALHEAAFQENFSQPVVDAFDPKLLVAPSVSHVIDFTTVKEEDLYEINIPLKFTASEGTRIHGLACWFDVLFDGSTVERWLTTAPGEPTTHWYQLRCVLSQPIDVMQGQEITGHLHMIAHSAQSYTINLTLSAKMCGPGVAQGEMLQTSSCKFDLKE